MIGRLFCVMSLHILIVDSYIFMFMNLSFSAKYVLIFAMIIEFNIILEIPN